MVESRLLLYCVCSIYSCILNEYIDDLFIYILYTLSNKCMVH